MPSIPHINPVLASSGCSLHGIRLHTGQAETKTLWQKSGAGFLTQCKGARCHRDGILTESYLRPWISTSTQTATWPPNSQLADCSQVRDLEANLDQRPGFTKYHLVTPYLPQCPQQQSGDGSSGVLVVLEAHDSPTRSVHVPSCAFSFHLFLIIVIILPPSLPCKPNSEGALSTLFTMVPSA